MAVIRHGELKPVKASQVQIERPDFLWMDRIPRKMPIVVGGKMERGKGVLLAHIAAWVSNAPMKRHGGRKGRVLVSAPEDDNNIVLRPRYEAAGANLDNVMFEDISLEPDDIFPFLGPLLLDEKIDLLIIDPFASHVPASTDVRQVIEPLRQIIQISGTAAVIVEHALKNVPSGIEPSYAIRGAGNGLVAAARMVYLFGTDPSDPDRRILAHVKGSICARRPALVFEMDTVEVPGTDDQPRLLLTDDTADIDPIRLVQAPSADLGRPPAKLAAARQWLVQYLYYVQMPVLASLVYEDAAKKGIAKATLIKARKKLGVIVDPPTGSQTMWALSDKLRTKMDADMKSDPVVEEHAETEEGMVTQELIDRWLQGDASEAPQPEDDKDDDDDPEVA